MENPHVDGIYKETWGFSWAMLVSGRVTPISRVVNSFEQQKQKLTNDIPLNPDWFRFPDPYIGFNCNG